MDLPKFTEWVLLKEGKKKPSEEQRQAYNAFISGKTNKVKLDVGTKVARGHQDHASGTGIHDARPNRERTRSTVTKKWRKEYE